MAVIGELLRFAAILATFKLTKGTAKATFLTFGNNSTHTPRALSRTITRVEIIMRESAIAWLVVGSSGSN
ncbi:hypothetical protein P3342_007604 [Pyrenophora teres f. teres]|nr:hypothetical protein P3342_007604 [Pyrenophora teres f. teres]